MSRSVSKTPVVVSLLGAFTVVAASCLALSEGPASASGKATPGVTATTITVAGFGTVSTTSGSPGVAQGVEARFAQVNRSGGIDGRKIKFLGVLDDAGSSSTNLQLAHEVVQKDHVFAVVPALGITFLPASANYLVKSHVPFYSWGYTSGYCYNDWGFGFNGCVVPPKNNVANLGYAAPFVNAVGLSHGGTVAISTDDTSPQIGALANVVADFTQLGAKVVYAEGNVPSTGTTDYQPYAQQIMTSNGGQPPQAVVLENIGENILGITAALKQAGYTGAIMNSTFYIPGFLAANPSVASVEDGSYVGTQWAPTEQGGPAIAQIRKDLNAIGQSSQQITIGVDIGYWSADVFIQMLQKVGRNLTSARFEKIINAGFTYKPETNPPGLGPVSFPADHSEPAPCSALLKIEGTAYKVVTRLTCYKDAPISASS